MRKDKVMALAIREDEYEFVDPRPEEMKHVNIKHHSVPDILET